VSEALLIRAFEERTDLPQLKTCVIAIQDFERQLVPSMPAGIAIADSYIDDLLIKCARYDGTIHVATVNKEIVGYATLYLSMRSDGIEDGDGSFAQIGDLVLLEAYRGQGFGRQMMIELSSPWPCSWKSRCSSGCCDCNSISRQRYQKCSLSHRAVRSIVGFVSVGDVAAANSDASKKDAGGQTDIGKRAEGLDPRAATDAQHRAIIEACRCLESDAANLSLDELASHCNLSSFHFHRLFKRLLGVTPGQYKKALARFEIQSQLRQAPTVTEALYASGFNSPSRFYARAREMLGMSPAAWRDGGSGTQIDHALVETQLGLLIVAASQFGVCHVAFGEDAASMSDELHTLFPKAEILEAEPVFSSTGKHSEPSRRAKPSAIQNWRTPLGIQARTEPQQMPVARTESHC